MSDGILWGNPLFSCPIKMTSSATMATTTTTTATPAPAAVTSTATTRILVKGIPKHLTEARFREHFSKIAAVTDARIMQTKDGRSRQFGFIGYRTAEEARRAVEYFDGTFVDTSRVNVVPAKAVGDPSLGRPWSRYSKGSSAYTKAHPSEPKPASAPTKAKKPAQQLEGEDAEELERFLSAMKVKHVKRKTPDAETATATTTAPGDADAPPSAKKAKVVEWDDDESDDDDDDEEEIAEAKPVAVRTAAVESKKPGGKGVFLQRTHVRFDGDDDAGGTAASHEGEVVDVVA
jgi:multiple RNA-binding domain-containing protein 1